MSQGNIIKILRKPISREIFKNKGMDFPGIYPQKNLVEIIELKGHPYFVAVQFHPEFKSKPDNSHPLFREFIGAALASHSKRPSISKD